jgi:hypothetical protein
MSRSALDDPPALVTHPVEPRHTRAQLRRTALDAVHQLNAHLLDLLNVRAREAASTFPLEAPLRARFANLTVAQRVCLARCGTLLVDAGFSDAVRWRRVKEQTEGTNEVSTPPHPWLPRDDALLIAQSTLLVAWSILNAARTEAGVLLAISPEVAGIISSMGVNQLSVVAQRYPQWVRLRWEGLPAAWSNLLSLAADDVQAGSGIGALRCLQLNGGHARWLEPYFDGRI